jgi:hypothetical protein
MNLESIHPKETTMLNKAFLSLALTVVLLGFGGVALAAALPMPAGYPTLLGASCGGVHVTTYITGFNADGTVAGEVYAWTSCSTGGRGSKPRKIEAYHTMAWDFFGGYTVSAYDAGPLVSGTYTDGYGNVASAINGVPDLQVNQIPPNAISLSAHVPAVIGLSDVGAQAAVLAAGLLSAVVTSCQNAYPAPHSVFNQSPAAGKVVPYQSQVTLYVSLGTVAYCNAND